MKATIPKKKPPGKGKKHEWSEAGYLHCERDRQKRPAELWVFTFALYLRQEGSYDKEWKKQIRMEYQREIERSRQKRRGEREGKTETGQVS